ncbi:MAG: sulfite exporter TauE/SafE family protein [Acidobacteria bacterium]|nr:MAG: sulfite exporter TauE/SafE family protein [Acidobacteriota bacterium]REK09243.1 MAG: sulfite exporter TauE/SafE family protein [Acidobacteriota bacterium]
MAWLGAFAIGLSLGLLGSGGSILTVPVLVFLVGVGEKQAIAESLAIVGLIAAGGALPRVLGKQVAWRSVVLFGVPGMLGAYGGAAAAAYVQAAFQLVLFAAIMLVAAVMMARPAASDPRLASTAQTDPSTPETPRAIWKIVLDGLLVGAVTGLVGVGGGFLIVPALVLLGGLSMHLAIGTSLVIIAMKSASGFLEYRSVLESLGIGVEWPRILLFAAVGFAGSLLGGRVADRVPRQALRRLFALFLVVMGAFIVWQYLPDLL